ISVDSNGILPLLGQFEGIVGYGDSPIVSGVFPNGQGSFDLDTVQSGKRVIALDQLWGLGLEFFHVLWGPPIVQVPILVELGPIVVKGMGKLMADDHSDAPVVDRIVRFLVIIGKLKDPGRKDDLIVGRSVIGRYRGRGGRPLLFVG